MTVFDLVAKVTLDTKGFESGIKFVKKSGEETKKAVEKAASSSSAFSKIENATKKVASAIAGIPAAVDKAGRAVSAFGGKIKSFGSSLENKITKPALAAGTALATMFLVKGWSRLTQIDEAKAKLRGLGHDAESVKNIMESALASVKGTAFGMDEAATTAASAVAAGIQKGEDLTRYLTSVGDAAAIAGTSMADMGAIFNKVTTAGKAQNDVLRQLADKGIPIYQWLAEETGHAAEEIHDLAKKGGVDLETFRRAVEKHVGGAAKQLGNATLTGAIANVGAAISRVGANFLGAADDADSFAGKILPLIIGLQDKLGVLEDKAKEYGKVFGELFGALIEYFTTGEVDIVKLGNTAYDIWLKIKPILDTLSGWVEKFKKLPPELQGALAAVALGIGPVLKYGGMLVQVIGFLISNGALLVAGLAVAASTLAILAANGEDVTGVFQFLSDLTDKVYEGLKNLSDLIANFDFAAEAEKISQALTDIFDFDGKFGDFLEVGLQIGEGIANGIADGAPVIIQAFSKILADGLIWLSEQIPSLVETGINVINGFIEGIKEAIPELAPAAIEIITTLATEIAGAIPELAGQAAEIITALCDYLLEHDEELAQAGSDAAVKIISAFVKGFVNNYPKVQEMGYKLLLTCIEGILWGIGALIDAASKLIVEFCTAIAKDFAPIMEKGKEVAGKIAEGIKAKFNEIKTKGKELIDNVIAGAKEKYSQLVAQGKEIIEKVKAGVTAAISVAQKAGKDIIDGIIKGINEEKDKFINAITNLMRNGLDAVKKFFGIQSPSKVMRDEVGAQIVKGLVLGITSNEHNVDNAIDRLSKKVHEGLDLAYDIPTVDLTNGIPKAVSEIQVSKTDDNTAILTRMDAMLAVMSEYFPEIAEKTGKGYGIEAINRGLGVIY